MPRRNVADRYKARWRHVEAWANALLLHTQFAADLKTAACYCEAAEPVFWASWQPERGLVAPRLDATSWLYLRYAGLWSVVPSLTPDMVRDALEAAITHGGNWKEGIKTLRGSYNRARTDMARQRKAVATEVLRFDRRLGRTIDDDALYADFPSTRRDPEPDGPWVTVPYADYLRSRGPSGDDDHVVMVHHLYATSSLAEVLQQTRIAWTKAHLTKEFGPATADRDYSETIALYEGRQSMTLQDLVTTVEKGELKNFKPLIGQSAITKRLKRDSWLKPRTEHGLTTLNEYIRSLSQQRDKTSCYVAPSQHIGTMPPSS